MAARELDEFGIIREVVAEILGQEAPEQLPEFELSYPAMYGALEDAVPADKGGGDGDPLHLSGDQLADATLIAAALWTTKALFRILADPLLEDRLLPRLDEVEERYSRVTRRPKLVKTVIEHLRRAIRRHLGLPPSA